VIDRVRELGWAGVVGNTDEVLWRPEERANQEARAPKLSGLFETIFTRHAPATLALIGEPRLNWLRGLPEHHRAGDTLLLHAGPGDLWRAPMDNADDAELVATYGDCGAAIVVYGHIHRPFVRRLAGMTVANSGSVGSPFDGDPRASYLLVEEGEPRVIRVDYDIEREVDALLRSGYPDAERLAETRRTASYIPPGS
jgi:Calcineurin-like phosphoesterase superfamily domain